MGASLATNGPLATIADACHSVPPRAVPIHEPLHQTSSVRSTLSAKKKKNVLPEYESDLPLFKALFSWHGTILPLVASRSSFWFLWASHGVFILLKKLDVFEVPDDDEAETASPPWAVIGVPTSLMVFFLVRPRR